MARIDIEIIPIPGEAMPCVPRLRLINVSVKGNSMPGSAKRVIWKGAISFGLVHIPVALHAATAEHHLDFEWLDKRTLDHVGYKRINKRTGKEIEAQQIVKGLERGEGEYVVLNPEEITTAYPKTTQTIEIEAFVALTEILFFYLDRPYYVTPTNKSGKVYALLREALHTTGKAGIAKVVIQTRQHLALLVPVGSALVLELLRWSDEIRDMEDLDFPPAGIKAAGLSASARAQSTSERRQVFPATSAAWAGAQSDKPLQLAL